MAAPRPASPRTLLERILGAIPFPKRHLPSAPEPFTSIEDSTPNADVLMSPNAASAFDRNGAGVTNLRSAVENLGRRRWLVVVLVAALGLLLVIAVTAIAVSLPPPRPAVAPPLDPRGSALVKTWLVPPSSPLDPRMEMERGSTPRYSPTDAIRLGLDPAQADVSKAAAADDAEAQRLFGAVR